MKTKLSKEKLLFEYQVGVCAFQKMFTLIVTNHLSGSVHLERLKQAYKDILADCERIKQGEDYINDLDYYQDELRHFSKAVIAEHKK